MEAQVSEEVKAERLTQLQELLRAQQQAFNDDCIGKTLPALLDRRGKKEGQCLGKTPYLQSIYVDASSHLFGQCVNVKIEKAFANSLTGTIVTTE